MSTDSIKKVSIIIPVYQAKKTIEKCVLSCLEQKEINPDELEIILVDDGSTDGSGQLCNELSQSDNLVKVIHTKNCGVSHARNIGIEKAQGKYICFVDADDYVSDEFIIELLREAESGLNIVDGTDSFLSGLCISGYQYIENSVLNRNTHVWGKLFRLDYIKEKHVMFKEGLTIGEDLLFLLDLALLLGKEKSVKCIASDGYHYVENAEGAMKGAFKESYMDELICWREAEQKLLEKRDYISNYAFVSVAASQIMTAFLVVGKLAQNTGNDKDSDRDNEINRDRNKDIESLVILRVKEQIYHALKTKGTFAAIELGYKIKVMIFKISPKLYLRLYCAYKKHN